GVDPLDPANDFTVRMAEVSTLDQEQRIEAMNLSLDLADKLRQVGDTLGIPAEGMANFIAENILGLTPYELHAVGQDVKAGKQASLNGTQQQTLVEEIARLIASDPDVARMVRNLRGEPVPPRRGVDEGPLPEKGAESPEIEWPEREEEDSDGAAARE